MAIPLLLEELTEVEQLNLAGLLQHPGYPALEKLLMAACRRANEEFVRLDPTVDGYERKLSYAQWKSRERNEFAMLVLKSIAYHNRVTEIREQEKNEKPPNNPFFIMPTVSDNKE